MTSFTTLRAQHILEEDLSLILPNACCCDCPREVGHKVDCVWTIWHSGHIYCPRCAKHERIDPDSAFLPFLKLRR